MTKESLLTLGTLFLVFISGVGIGSFFGSAHSSDVPKNKTSIPRQNTLVITSAMENQSVELNARVQELEAELAARNKDQAAAIMADRLAS